MTNVSAFTTCPSKFVADSIQKVTVFFCVSDCVLSATNIFVPRFLSTVSLTVAFAVRLVGLHKAAMSSEMVTVRRVSKLSLSCNRGMRFFSQPFVPSRHLAELTATTSRMMTSNVFFPLSPRATAALTILKRWWCFASSFVRWVTMNTPTKELQNGMVSFCVGGTVINKTLAAATRTSPHCLSHTVCYTGNVACCQDTPGEFSESPNVKSRATLSEGAKGLGFAQRATATLVSPNNNPAQERPASRQYRMNT